MADHGFPRVNFLSLDVEGSEERVMQTVVHTIGKSPEDFPFDVVLVEADRHGAPERPAEGEDLRRILRSWDATSDEHRRCHQD